MLYTGRKTKVVYILDIKCNLPVDNVVSKILNYQRFGRKTNLRLYPDHISDLGWQLLTSIDNKVSATSDVHTYAKSQLHPVSLEQSVL